MSISNVNLAMSASSWGAYNQKLTEATKQKLDEYGISYEPTISEQQAKNLIQKYEQAHNNQSSFSKNQKTLKDNQASSSKDEIKEKLLQLAKNIGISVDEKEENKKIASIIEQALEGKIVQAQNNKPLLEQLKNFSRDLASIQAQSNGSAGYDNTNQALMMSLEMLSLYNKNYLNR